MRTHIQQNEDTYIVVLGYIYSNIIVQKTTREGAADYGRQQNKKKKWHCVGAIQNIYIGV
jgi:hypothetical protein